MPKKPPTSPKADLQSAHELRATLQASLDQAEWSWIARHLERDAVIVVAPSLELVEAGVRIAQDDAATVQAWITEGKIGKPTQQQLDTWNAAPAKRFQTLVVQPYVLVREFLH